MVEQEINEKFVTSDVQPVLPPDKRESRSQLKKEPGDMTGERPLDITFLCIFRKSKMYGSFSASRARSDCCGGKVSLKFVTALPARV
jgi:hypothetical protein